MRSHNVCLFLSVYLAQHKVSCFLQVILCDSISSRIDRIVFCHVCGSIWRWSGRCLHPWLRWMMLGNIGVQTPWWGSSFSPRTASTSGVIGSCILFSFLWGPCRVSHRDCVHLPFRHQYLKFLLSPGLCQHLFDILKIAMLIDMWWCLLCFSWQRNLLPRLVLKPTTWLVL